MLNVTIEGYLLNVTKYSFEDEKTGEVIRGCKIDYLIEKESSPNSVGYIVLDCTSKIENFDYISKRIMKPVLFQLKPVMNKGKFKITHIDDYELS